MLYEGPERRTDNSDNMYLRASRKETLVRHYVKLMDISTSRYILTEVGICVVDALEILGDAR